MILININLLLFDSQILSDKLGIQERIIQKFMEQNFMGSLNSFADKNLKIKSETHTELKSLARSIQDNCQIIVMQITSPRPLIQNISKIEQSAISQMMTFSKVLTELYNKYPGKTSSQKDLSLLSNSNMVFYNYQLLVSIQVLDHVLKI